MWCPRLNLPPFSNTTGSFTRDSFSSLGPGSSLLSMSSSGGERAHIGVHAKHGGAGMGRWAHPGPAVPGASQGSRQPSGGSGQQPSLGSGQQQVVPQQGNRSGGEGRFSAASSLHQQPVETVSGEHNAVVLSSKQGSTAGRESGSTLQRPSLQQDHVLRASLANPVTLHHEGSTSRQEAQAAGQQDAAADR